LGEIFIVMARHSVRALHYYKNTNVGAGHCASTKASRTVTKQVETRSRNAPIKMEALRHRASTKQVATPQTIASKNVGAGHRAGTKASHNQ
jgi:hypothetical protein